MIFGKLWTSSLFLKIPWLKIPYFLLRKRKQYSKLRKIFKFVQRLRSKVWQSNSSKVSSLYHFLGYWALKKRLTFQKFCFSKIIIPYHRITKILIPLWYVFEIFLRSEGSCSPIWRNTWRRAKYRDRMEKKKSHRRLIIFSLKAGIYRGNNCSRLKTITSPDCSFLAENWTNSNRPNPL